MMIRDFINYNRKACFFIDSVLPGKFKLSGGTDFEGTVIPSYLTEGQLIYDVGGGKRPYLGRMKKEEINAKVIGIDISSDECS